jgi:hypothetical protein
LVETTLPSTLRSHGIFRSFRPLGAETDRDYTHLNFPLFVNIGMRLSCDAGLAALAETNDWRRCVDVNDEIVTVVSTKAKRQPRARSIKHAG